MSSSSSASPEPPLTALKSKPRDKKGKKKAVSAPQAAGRGRSEGVDPTWAYKPPSGVVLLDTISKEAQDAGEFDWDAVANNPELELWLIRVPDAVKPRTLENAIVALPASSSQSAHVGTIHRKHVSFDVWSVGDDDNEHVSGEEIKSISCLLPKNGTLYPSPKPIARHLVIAAQAVTPTPNPNSASSGSHKNPPRQCYPKDLLKHRFLPIGALAEDANTMTMDVDMEIQPPEPEQATISSQLGLTQTPKKQKKTKEKVSKADVDIDAGADRPLEALELEPTPTSIQTQAKHKKEKKDKKGTELEVQAESTPVKAKTKKRKSLEDGETPMGTTPKKTKRAKLSTPLPA